MLKTEIRIAGIRKDASDALEILLQYFDGERPAPFDEVIDKLIAIETTAIKMQQN